MSSNYFQSQAWRQAVERAGGSFRRLPPPSVAIAQTEARCEASKARAGIESKRIEKVRGK